MSKRPTFSNLITAYGDARSALAHGQEADLPPGDMVALADRALEARLVLERALRKAGIPLAQVAP